MIITITNPRNKKFINFLGEQEYRKKHGVKSMREKAQIAMIHRDYELYARGVSGLFSLPVSQSYFVKGYRQSGTDYQYNTYENRIITFEFVQQYGLSSTQQAQVFNQQGQLLDITIKTEANEYAIKGHFNGTIERGIVELECPYPYFVTPNYIIQNELIQKNPAHRKLLPLQLPATFFGSSQEKGVIEVDAVFPTDFTITLTGSFTDLKLIGVNEGTNLLYNGSIRESMIISTADESMFVDGNDVSMEVKGLYPTLIEGINQFEFMIPEGNQETDVKVRLEYQEVLGNIA
jgi:hypothetical protein